MQQAQPEQMAWEAEAEGELQMAEQVRMAEMAARAW
jgi:hypothetical protein